MSTWISSSDIKRLPKTGQAWNSMLIHATKYNNLLAKAYVSERIGDEEMEESARQDVIKAVKLYDTIQDLYALIPCIIVADLITLSYDDDTRFKKWLTDIVTEPIDGETLIGTFKRDPGHKGTMAGALLALIGQYTNSHGLVIEVRKVFKTWLGDLENDFEWGCYDYYWSSTGPVGVNPFSSVLSVGGFERNIDGVMPYELRWTPIEWPPIYTNCYRTLQGVIIMAEVLYQKGHPVYEWHQKAILRCYRWLNEIAKWPADGEDKWQINIINSRYNTNYKTTTTACANEIMGFTSWTHQNQKTKPRILNLVKDRMLYPMFSDAVKTWEFFSNGRSFDWYYDIQEDNHTEIRITPEEVLLNNVLTGVRPQKDYLNVEFGMSDEQLIHLLSNMI